MEGRFRPRQDQNGGGGGKKTQIKNPGPPGKRGRHLQKVDVVLGAVQLLEARLLFLQLVDLLLQALDQGLGLVEGRLLVDADQLGDLRPHPVDGADHVLEHLLALHHGSLGRILQANAERVRASFTP